MKSVMSLTGLYRVDSYPVTRKATRGAGSTGLTGLTGLAARVREYFLFSINDCHATINKFLACAKNNPVNPVNPVEATSSKGFGCTGLALTLLDPVNTGGDVKKTSMREDMPTIAAWVDELRVAFGADEINAQIRKGLRGDPTFYASENGHKIGTRVDCGARYRTWRHPVTGVTMCEEIAE